MQSPEALVQAGDWVLLATIVGCIAFVLWVTARRPADDRDAFIRKLRPPSQPQSVRADHLRLLMRQEIAKHAKIDAVFAVVLTILGVSVAASDQAPIGVSVTAIALFVVPQVILYPIFAGLFLLARYRGVQLRLRNDVVWHGSGVQPPAAPNGT